MTLGGSNVCVPVYLPPEAHWVLAIYTSLQTNSISMDRSAFSHRLTVLQAGRGSEVKHREASKNSSENEEGHVLTQLSASCRPGQRQPAAVRCELHIFSNVDIAGSSG